MVLAQLGIADFRCIRSVALPLHPRLNLITGPNASGKTSLLEAFFFLGRGRSFRTAQASTLVREGAQVLRVTGVTGGASGAEHRLGVEYGRGGFQVRIDGARQDRLASLAERLSVAVIDPTVHELVAGGPEGRRRFLDWGAFHVEHRFLEAWRRYQRALRQRNASLRSGAHASEVETWTGQVADAGDAVDTARRRYADALGKRVAASGRQLLGAEITCSYRSGWAQDLSLKAALARDLERDRATGTTRSGPHRADLSIRMDAQAAKDRVSRGQGKLVGAALMLAQVALQAECTGSAGVVLLDDPASELDDSFLRLLLVEVMALPAQLVMTGLDSAGLPVDREHSRFHVEQGEIRQSE